MIKTDLLVIGGGVIGLNLALAYKSRYPKESVTLIEKEQQFAAHASGRNSGVLHAGFYYSDDSLKARFTREGNEHLTNYCLERGLRINRCGKLVVTKNEQELETLHELLKRGKKSGVTMHAITEREAREIEPRVKTIDEAIFSPTTSSVDPREVMTCMVADAKDLGIIIETGTAYVGRDGQTIKTSNGDISPGYVINAAGLYADKVAQDFGFSKNYRILPFKGLYLYSDEPAGAIRTHIYPVPDLRNPFLGVHFTLTADNHIKVGPTAIPAFWREHYGGLANFDPAELLEIVFRELGLLWKNEFGFRKLAVSEMSKYYKPRMAKLATTLLSGVKADAYTRWGTPGIRAQLFDIKNKRLEQDFRFEGDQFSFHVLNAVSPAFTCSIPFCRYLIDQIELARAGH